NAVVFEAPAPGDDDVSRAEASTAGLVVDGLEGDRGGRLRFRCARVHAHGDAHQERARDERDGGPQAQLRSYRRLQGTALERASEVIRRARRPWPRCIGVVELA